MQGGVAAPDAAAREPAPAVDPSAVAPERATEPAATGPIEGELVTWTAPPECPDDAAMERRIAELVASSSARDGVARAQVQRDGDAYVVDVIVAIDGTEHQRALRAPDCESLADAAALVVALTLDPTALGGEPDATTTTTTTTTTTVAPDATARAPAEATREAEDATPARGRRARGEAADPPRAAATPRMFELGGRLWSGWGSALAPRGSALLGGALVLTWRRVALEAEARMWLPRALLLGQAVAARIWLGSALLAACLRPPTRRVEFGLCPALETGGTRARGVEVVEPTASSNLWVAPVGRIALRVPLRRGLGLVAGVEVAAPLQRVSVNVSGDQLWLVKPISFRILLGLDGRGRP